MSLPVGSLCVLSPFPSSTILCDTVQLGSVCSSAPHGTRSVDIPFERVGGC